jgi:transposase
LIFYNDTKGFPMLEDWARKLAEHNGFKDITLGMELTGHYWFNLGEHIKKKGMRIVLVNPHVESRWMTKPKQTDKDHKTTPCGQR